MAALTPALRCRVDLAFLDPPYNAARERWIYPDRILGRFGSIVGAEGEDPLRHDKWLSMMYPRLALLRVLLAQSGALFMTLDDHEVYHARVLLDEIFSPENFLANITWEKTQAPRRHWRALLESHTHVITYARNAKIWRPNPSAGRVPTIWSAASLGPRETQMVAPSRPGAPYPLTPKPVGLLRCILRIATSPDALVLDLFAGSGTTAQAVLEQNASDGVTGGSSSSRPMTAPGPSSLAVSRRCRAASPTMTSTPSWRTARILWSAVGPRPGAHAPEPALGDGRNCCEGPVGTGRPGASQLDPIATGAQDHQPLLRRAEGPPTLRTGSIG